MKIVIVGASFAGMSCAVEATKLYPDAHITLIDRVEELLYRPNAVNRLLKKEIDTVEAAKSNLWEQLDEQAIDLRLGYDLLAIDTNQQVLRLAHQGQEQVLAYDRLVLAMGAEQSQQLADESIAPYLVSFKGKKALHEAWEKIQAAHRMVVVGAGQIGLEMIDALVSAGISVECFDTQKGPLSKHLDLDLSRYLLLLMKRSGVPVHVETGVDRVTVNPNGQGVLLETRSGSAEGDLVALATNFSPNTKTLPKQLEQNPDGSLWVDEYLRTSVANIWAIGDMIQLPIAYFGQAYLPTIKNAVLTGRVAATNLNQPILALRAVKRRVNTQVLGHTVLSLGLTERELDLWEDFFSLKHAGDGTYLTMHFQEEEKKLLGLQLISDQVTKDFTDQLTIAVEKQMSLEEIVLELYALEATSEQELILLTLLQEALGGQDED